MGKVYIWETVWPALDGTDTHARMHMQTDTNRHVDLKPHHPALFQLPVNGYNTCLRAVQPNPILSTAGSDTATILHSVCVCVSVRERERRCLSVSKCVGVCFPGGAGNEFTSQECTAESGCFYIKTPTVCL